MKKNPFPNQHDDFFPWRQLSTLLGIFSAGILAIIGTAFWLFMDNHNDGRYVKREDHIDYVKTESEHFTTVETHMTKMWEAINSVQSDNNKTGQQLSLVNERLAELQTQVAETKGDVKMLLFRKTMQPSQVAIP